MADYTILRRGQEIYLHNNFTHEEELLTGRSADKIPPRAKITIKRSGMSRVQVASILDLILGDSEA